MRKLKISAGDAVFVPVAEIAATEGVLTSTTIQLPVVICEEYFCPQENLCL